MARQISVQRAAMTSFLRPVFFTASTTRASSQVLIQVRSLGFCFGKSSCNPLISLPPRSSTTVVRIVGTSNIFAAFARPTTLFTIIIGSWVGGVGDGEGWGVVHRREA